MIDVKIKLPLVDVGADHVLRKHAALDAHFLFYLDNEMPYSLRVYLVVELKEAHNKLHVDLAQNALQPEWGNFPFAN